MKQELLKQEKRFFQQKYISNKDWLNQTLHEDFIECGKSGYLFHKLETIQALLDVRGDRNIQIYNYTYQQIDENSYMVHYMTKADGKYYYRTSIWIKNKHLQLLFHQATELKEQSKEMILF